MRLHKHDELVEAMARQLFIRRCDGMLPDYIEDGRLDIARTEAIAALDALLEAAVRLGVGHLSVLDCMPPCYTLHLKVEASDEQKP